MSLITLSSCFYIIKSKFKYNTYIDWMNNLISIVNNFNLVIYTDLNSCQYIKTNNNHRIKIIIKPIEQFYCYKYKNNWIKNHDNNILLNNISSWELNMLWSEKVYFVFETVNNKYFDTEYYGWCDIGYFRNRPNDTNINVLSSWPSNNTILMLNKMRIHYACVNNNRKYIYHLIQLINNKNEIPAGQQSIAGGFFLLHKTLVEWWKLTYYNKLDSFFLNNTLVKDDQIIIANCVFSNIAKFQIHYEDTKYDNWFMFQRLLL